MWKYMRFYAGPTLLVIDELGYLPLPAEAASALFQVVSQRYLKTSIAITTNRGVGAWGEILGDTSRGPGSDPKLTSNTSYCFNTVGGSQLRISTEPG
jgi:DNA replication protein DnaC